MHKNKVQISHNKYQIISFNFLHFLTFHVLFSSLQGVQWMHISCFILKSPWVFHVLFSSLKGFNGWTFHEVLRGSINRHFMFYSQSLQGFNGWTFYVLSSSLQGFNGISFHLALISKNKSICIVAHVSTKNYW